MYPIVYKRILCTTYTTDKILKPDDLEKVCDALHPVKQKWRVIGRKLGVKRANLNNIEDQYLSRGNNRCLEEMVSIFLNSPDLNRTWKCVIDALRHELVGEGALALEIERRYRDGEPDIKEGDQEAPVESTPTREYMTDLDPI